MTTTTKPRSGYRLLTLADIMDACNDGSLTHLTVRTLKPEAAQRETDAHGADVRFYIAAYAHGAGDDRQSAVEMLDYVRDNIEGYGTCPNGEAGVFVSAAYACDGLGLNHGQIADEDSRIAMIYVGGSIRDAHIDWRDL